MVLIEFGIATHTIINVIGMKARSTLVPAEEWLREFIPYGTPCDEPCEDQTVSGKRRTDELEAQVAQLRAEIEALKATQADQPRRSGTGS